MAEIWDAYDENFCKIEDVELVRGEAVPEGMYHLCGEIIVQHTDGTYLLMQRDFRKHLGGKWELTAGGSALKGETALDCALRELQEETGICAKELKELGRVVHRRHRTLYAAYLCSTDWDKEAITLQEGETVAFKWVEKEELLDRKIGELATTRLLQFI